MKRIERMSVGLTTVFLAVGIAGVAACYYTGNIRWLSYGGGFLLAGGVLLAAIMVTAPRKPADELWSPPKFYGEVED